MVVPEYQSSFKPLHDLSICLAAWFIVVLTPSMSFAVDCDHLISKYEKNKIIRYVQNNRNGAITIYINEKYSDAYGNQSHEYINAETICRDLGIINISAAHLDKIFADEIREEQIKQKNTIAKINNDLAAITAEKSEKIKAEADALAAMEKEKTKLKEAKAIADEQKRQQLQVSNREERINNALRRQITGFLGLIVMIGIIAASFFVLFKMIMPSKKEIEEREKIKKNNKKVLGEVRSAEEIVILGTIVQVTSGNIKHGSPRLENWRNCGFESWYLFEDNMHANIMMILIYGNYGYPKTYYADNVIKISGNIESVDTITVGNRTESNILTGGLIGGAIMGPVGAAAGALLSRRNVTDVYFECKTLCGKNFIGITDQTTYSKFVGAKINTR